MLSLRSLDLKKPIKVIARSSNLSRAQVKEVYEEISAHFLDIVFEEKWIETLGDRQLHISLKQMEKTDFFTREIDQLLLDKEGDLAVHSAKDLPDPLPKGLELFALTRGVDPSDVLVLRDGETLEGLPEAARIGTSSVRREKAVSLLRMGLCFVDIRGTIESRLYQLDTAKIDGVIMAEAALIRLNLTTRNRIQLRSSPAPLQGQLAIVGREGDEKLRAIFSCIDTRLR